MCMSWLLFVVVCLFSLSGVGILLMFSCRDGCEYIYRLIDKRWFFVMVSYACFAEM